jgi:hypothetical protein
MYTARFEISLVMMIQIAVFWTMMLQSDEVATNISEDLQGLHLEDTFRNVSILPHHYMVPQPRTA